MLGSDALLQSCTACSWDRCKEQFMLKTFTYLILPERCRFSLCSMFTGNNQLQQVSWLITAGTVSTSFNSSVQCLENMPQGLLIYAINLLSLQMQYYEYPRDTSCCDSGSPRSDFIFWLTWLFSFHFKSFFFGFCDTFVYGSLIVSRIATSKGNFFIPKRGCFNMTVGKVRTPKINK